MYCNHQQIVLHIAQKPGISLTTQVKIYLVNKQTSSFQYFPNFSGRFHFQYKCIQRVTGAELESPAIGRLAKEKHLPVTLTR